MPAPGATAPTRERVRTAVALAATLVPAAACWIVLARWMPGMDRGVATELGPLRPFLAFWLVMTAAMMLPAAAPAVVGQVRASHRVRGVPLLIGGYLLAWMLVGLGVHALYQPHGPVAAGATAIAAGCYELTAAKRHFRRHCRAGVRSGIELGLACVGSCLGLMLLLVALGVMSLTWTVVVTALILGQRALPPRTAVDRLLGLSLFALGLLLVVAPAAVPGTAPAPHHAALGHPG